MTFTRSIFNFDTRSHIEEDLPNYSYSPSDFWLFDHNGYDLTGMEIRYCENAGYQVSTHRHNGHVALKRPWFIDHRYEQTGAHLNHAALFERKAYAGLALYQLREIAQYHPVAFKVINIQAKWGIDLSIDYVDTEGNTFEVFHYEYDVFDHAQAVEAMQKVEQVVFNTDWNDAARQLLKCRDEWISLDFFAMSNYKSSYFGLPPERFKETVWHGN